MRNLLRQGRFNVRFRLSVDQVGFGYGHNPGLYKQFRIVFLQFVQEYPVFFPDIPAVCRYKEQQYGSDNEPMNVTLAANAKTNWDPIYILPNWAFQNPSGSNPYTLALATDRKNYDASQFADNLNAMIRNNQFNITARITASASIEITYEQVPWTEVTIDVPDFD